METVTNTKHARIVKTGFNVYEVRISGITVFETNKPDQARQFINAGAVI